MEQNAPLRTFVAIELPEEVLAAVGRAQRALATKLPGRMVRWTRPEGIHLTLKFLGDTPADWVPDLERLLRESLAGVQTFHLALAPLGVFPNSHAPRVVWVGLAGDLAALGALQRRVEEAISPLGFPAEQRPFSPHLTLGRVADFASPADRREVGATVGAASLQTQARLEVAEVCLIRSELGPGGARYTRLFAVPLG